MIDLYALPRDFPGKTAHTATPPIRLPMSRPWKLLSAIDIGSPRFIPYLQLHEYETMLFADPEVFRAAFENCDPAIKQLKTIAENVSQHRAYR